MKRTGIQANLANGETAHKPISRTNKVTKSSPQLNLGLDKRVAIVLKGNEEDLFHLVG